jgi:hypothetical protein
MNDAQLTALVQSEVDAALDAGIPVHKNTVRSQIVGRHCEHSDSDFALACAHHAIGDIVGRLIRNAKKAEAEGPDPQLVLPGYKHLQQRYAIDRDGESYLVRLEDMTVEEGRSKAAALRVFAQGALAHADELDAYFDNIEATAAQ